jgi:stalled ribosome rescue protein Dom34
MKKYKRGYPVAFLVGFNGDCAVLWSVFSNVVKPEKTLTLTGSRKDPKALYNFHESIINALRPTLKEGVRSVILVSPARTTYAQEFLEHVRGHHTWLSQGSCKAVFSELAGSATSLSEVAALAKAPLLRKVISETTEEETENLIGLLEKQLNVSTQNELVLYSLEQIEDVIFGSWKIGKSKPEYLMLTDTYLAGARQKGRLQRLMQTASNRGVKTRIVKADTAAGKRLLQLGGMVCILKQ